MSDKVVASPTEGPATRSRRGQSMVEFALLLPMLLVILLGVADFGRVFAAGITVEASARDAAEVVAQEYLRNPPAPMSEPAPGGNDPYYGALHDLAAVTACRETRSLPEATYTPDAPGTLGVNEEACAAMPVIQTCIHDGADTRCGTVAYGASIPSRCTEMADAMTPAMEGGTEDSRYVEVRVCYRFRPLFTDIRLPFGWDISVGEIWLQKERVFNVGWYPPPPTPVPPPPPPPPPPTDAPSEEPSPSPSPSPSEEPSPSPSAEVSPTPLPEDTPTPEPTPSPEPTPPRPTPTPTPSPEPEP